MGEHKQMNILFVGPYRQNDEWGRRSRDLLTSLQNTEHCITSRPVFMVNDKFYDDYIEKAEFTPTNKEYDILIQFVLQPYAIRSGLFKKHVGIFNYNTVPTNVPIGSLSAELLMDEVWTYSAAVQKALSKKLKDAKSDTVTRHIPLCLDTSNLPESTQTQTITEELRDRFSFYYIGNPLDRLGAFRETYLAYATAFAAHDEVALLVLPNINIKQGDFEAAIQQMQKEIGPIHGAGRYPYLHMIPHQHGYWSPNTSQATDRIAMHNACDCLISPGYSIEASSFVLEAALYHNTPIIHKGNACYDWMGEDNFWGIDFCDETCFTASRPVHFRFTSHESWCKPNIHSLTKAMQQAYANKYQRDKKKEHNSKLRKLFEENIYNAIIEEVFSS